MRCVFQVLGTRTGAIRAGQPFERSVLPRGFDYGTSERAGRPCCMPSCAKRQQIEVTNGIGQGVDSNLVATHALTVAVFAFAPALHVASTLNRCSRRRGREYQRS